MQPPEDPGVRELHPLLKYVLFEGEGHGWRKTKNRITSTVAIVEWFERYLK